MNLSAICSMKIHANVSYPKVPYKLVMTAQITLFYSKTQCVGQLMTLVFVNMKLHLDGNDSGISNQQGSTVYKKV